MHVTSCGQRHGHNTYGSDDSDIDEDEFKPKGQKKNTTGGQCKYGSTTDQCTNHSDCPLNVKKKVVFLRMTEHLTTVMSFIILIMKIPRLIQKAFL